MPAINFASRFARDVATLRKRTTIRRARKHPIQPGDVLYLYTGMRTKACEKLVEATCRAVWDIRITEDEIILGGKSLDYERRRALIERDGLKDEDEFRAWFRDHYGLPFDGVVISW